MDSISSIQIQQIQAIGLTVTDLDRAIDFYTQALDFEVVADRLTQVENLNKFSILNSRVATLKLGDEIIKLSQYLDAKGKSIPADSQTNDRWFQHLAIVVSDMERAYDRLQSLAIESISTAPQTIPIENQAAANIQAFKFRDPDRHPLELICFPPDKGQQKWHQQTDRLFLGIDHTAIAIDNTVESLKFYHDYLGMQIAGGSLNWGETQARLDGLPTAEVKITALRPTQGGMGIELLDYLKPDRGRPMPIDLDCYDPAYMQVEALAKIDDRTDRLTELIRDPNGHFILLTTESKN